MMPHQERVVIEQTDLQIKLDKLRTFLESEFAKKIDTAEQDRLTMQEIHMNAYNDVLKERITNFNQKG